MTSSINDASATCFGSAVNSPGVSVSRAMRSAPTRFDTRAARRSLSPKRISSSATASFSLTMGTTPSSSRWSRVWRACRYCWRWKKSSGASSTWPATRPCRANSSIQAWTSSGWPTAETAWSTAGSLERVRPSPSADQPAAMAPELTTTTRRDSARTCAICAQIDLMAAASTWPPSVVTDEVPSFTTNTGRRAPLTGCSSGAGVGRLRPGARPVRASCRARSDTR